MNNYMGIALKEANKAYKKNEVPVGAIIVKNNKIIAKGYNRKEKDKLVTSHAEINAISKACKRIKDWRLNDCIMYVTLKPCLMCQEVIKESRISKVYYLIESFEKDKINKNVMFKMENYSSNEYKIKLQKFFNSKRK